MSALERIRALCALACMQRLAGRKESVADVYNVGDLYIVQFSKLLLSSALGFALIIIVKLFDFRRTGMMRPVLQIDLNHRGDPRRLGPG